MAENRFYTQETHGPYELHGLGDYELEGGGVLPNCQVAYASFGTLSTEKDNVVLVPTWYAGTHLFAQQVYIGPGRALDPARYFIVVANQIGNGLSTSPHHFPAPAGARFPAVAIGDDVRAQAQLLRERFGVERLELVFGASMGAMQAYEWAVRYPEMVRRLAPLAGTARTTTYGTLLGDALIDALASDPGFAEGAYESVDAVRAGLRRHARLWALMGYSSEFYKREQWRDLGYTSERNFQNGFMAAYFSRMDPNNLVAMIRKWQSADVGRHAGGDLAAALGRITARTYVLAIDEDLCFPARDLRTEQELVPGSELRLVRSLSGHQGIFGFEASFRTQVDEHLAELLADPT
jgi:homoserine O-acetyltransferase